MDLVDFDEAVFARIQKELEDFSSKLEVRDIRYIPDQRP
jgi:sulfate adenylyltransferase subunit 1 (EFTu-like GTPase family)